MAVSSWQSHSWGVMAVVILERICDTCSKNTEQKYIELYAFIFET